MQEHRKRVALVIGGGSGIGRASARVLAASGHIVIIADRDVDSAMRAAEAAFAGARDHGQNGFKIELGKRTLVRALLQAQAMEV